jgi:hypothetical protein
LALQKSDRLARQASGRRKSQHLRLSADPSRLRGRLRSAIVCRYRRK